MIENMAVGTTAKLLFKASADIERETNWDHFREGIPSHLKLIEGLLSLQPNNEDLLVSAIKGYGGYAYAVNETLYLEDFYREVSSEDSQHHRFANINYSKALSFSRRYFKTKGLSFDKLMKIAGNQVQLNQLLDQKLESSELKDQEAILYTAQSLGGLININRDQMLLVAQLSLVKSLFNWVCERNPEISFGTCRIFMASYESGRPRALGGNPEEGKGIFLKGIKDYPNNWLIDVNYLQYYVIPMSDEREFNRISRKLNKLKNKFRDNQVWKPGSHKVESENDRIHLFQSIALKRFEIITKFKKELF